MKRYSIRQYVAWLTLTPLLVMAVSLESYFLQDHYFDLDRNLMERSQLIASQLASSSEYGVFAKNLPFLQNLAENVLRQPDVRGVIILDAASGVLIDAGEFSGTPGTAASASTAITRARQVMDTVNLQAPVHLDSESLRIYHPIEPAQVVLDELDAKPAARQRGAVIVEMSRTRTVQSKWHATRLTVGATVLFLIFPSGLIYLGSRKITFPIRKLSDAVQTLGEGHLETRVAVSAQVAELDALAGGINDMAERLQQDKAILLQRTANLTEVNRQITAIFDATVDGILVADVESRRFVNGNRSICDMLGYRLEELASLTVNDIHPPESLAHVLNQFERQARGEIRVAADLPVKRKDGSIFYADISTAPAILEERNCLVGIFHDVTERKRAEEQIRRQQELTIRIIETIPMRVFWKDRDSRYLGCNTLFARDAGRVYPEELTGKTDFEMGWREQAKLYRADDRRVMDTDTAKVSYDEPQTTPDGKHIWLRTSKVPLHDEAGKVIGVLGTYEDITGRKNTEIALQESEERFRMAFQNSAIGMALVGTDGRWLKVNDALCRIVGYPERELLGKTFQDITHPDDLQADLDHMRRLLAGEIGSYYMEKRYLHKDGHVVWVLLGVSLMRDAQGTPLHFISQIEDVSERKQAEAQILKLNEELERKVQERTRQLLAAQGDLVRKEKLAVLGQVAGSVGHELRNPLGVMSNAVYFLQTVLPDTDETTREYLNIIKNEISASERIVSDLLDSVRTKPPHAEAVSAGELIAQALRKCTVPSSVMVKLDIPATLPPLRVDAQQIHQVFLNLISNGIEAMTDEGVLEIGAVENRQDKNITISVRDSGAGIAPEVLPKLFQPLFTTKARGIGLGLVVVKNLTEANGGKIEVQSEPGKGSAFLVTLPCS